MMIQCYTCNNNHILIYISRMKEHPFAKMKIPSFKNIEKKQSKQDKGQEQFEEINFKTASLEQLRNRAKDVRKQLSEKQQELLSSQKTVRIETFKNQNYKSQVTAFEKKCQSVRIALAQRLIEQYKQNQESPLFHNEHGLSPFQMLLLHYSRNQSHSETICMICYMDIQMNSHIVELPCSHILHRQCAVQHLLYSRNCPGCTQEIIFTPPQHKFLKK